MATIQLVGDQWFPTGEEEHEIFNNVPAGSHILKYGVACADGEVFRGWDPCSYGIEYQGGEINENTGYWKNSGKYLYVLIPPTNKTTPVSLTAEVYKPSSDATKPGTTTHPTQTFNVAGDTTSPTPISESSLTKWSTETFNYSYDEIIEGGEEIPEADRGELLNRIANSMARNFQNVYDVSLKVENEFDDEKVELLLNRAFEYEFTVSAKDKLGNTLEAGKEIFYLNSESELLTFEIKADPEGWTNGQVELTIDKLDHVTYYYSKSKDDENPKKIEEDTVTVTENGTYWFTAKDDRGNVFQQAYDVKIDTIAPSAPVISQNEGDDYVEIVIVPPSEVDGAPIKEVWYQINGEEPVKWDEESSQLIVKKDCLITAWVVDEAGNKSKSAESNVYKFDKTPPEAPKVTVSTEELTNKDVYVTVDFAKDAAVRQYSINGGEWQNYTGAIRMTQNGTIRLLSADAAGNKTITECSVRNIDKTAPKQPTVSASITEATNLTVTLTATFAEDSVKNEYSFDGKNWSVYPGALVLKENATVYFRSTDAAGNSSTVSYPVTNIYPDPDNTQPENNPYNNTPNNPSLVDTNIYGEMTVKSVLSAADNVDAYKFTGNRIGNLSVSLTDLAAGVKVRVTVYANGKKMKSVNLKGSGTNIFKNIVAGDTIVVENTTKVSKYVATGYTLYTKANFFPEPTTGDDAVSAATTAVINMTDSTTGRSDLGWVGIGDVSDCYRVNMKNAGMLSLNITEVEGNTKLKVTLYDANGKKIKSKSVNGSMMNVFKKQQLVKTDICYIQVESGDKGKGKHNSTFRLEVNQAYFPKETVVNDSISQAEKVDVKGSGEIVSNAWVGVGDTIDFYKLNFTDANMATLSFNIGGLSSKVKVTLYDSNGNVIKSKSTSKNKADLFKPQTLVGGCAYLSVESGDKGKGKNNTYYSLDVVGSVYASRTSANNGMLA